MTTKLYYKDAYIQTFEAVVIDCIQENQEYKIVLDQTAFYPEGGGQPSDVGEMTYKNSLKTSLEGDEVEASASEETSIEVLTVQEQSDIIYHYTKEAIPVGTTVTGILNWTNRFHNMQNHSGEHILSGLIHATYGYDNVGFHMGTDAITLDMNGMLTEEQLLELEARANEIVFSNVPVVIQYPSKEELQTMEYRSKKELDGQVRIVSFPNADTCACCGTHVKNSGEIGLIKVLGFMKHRGGIRIDMLCGYRALADYNSKQKNIATIGAMLSAQQDKTAEAVLRMKEEKQQLEFQVGQLQQQLFQVKAEQYQEGSKLIFLEEEGISPIGLRQYATLLKQKSDVVFLYSLKEETSDGSIYNYVAASNSQDMRGFSKELNQAFQGKGGGSVQMVQGSLCTTKEKLKQYITQYNVNMTLL